MGKHSPLSKRDKRKKQKARRKLKFDNVPPQQMSEGSLSSSGLQDTECQHKSNDDVLGLDLDVLEMTLEDTFTAPDERLPYEYLDNCRKNLMRKVEMYHIQLQDMRAKNAQMRAQHCLEIERIRSFYKNIAFGHSRTGRIVRNVICTSKEAKTFVQELGY